MRRTTSQGGSAGEPDRGNGPGWGAWSAFEDVLDDGGLLGGACAEVGSAGRFLPQRVQDRIGKGEVITGPPGTDIVGGAMSGQVGVPVTMDPSAPLWRPVS